jgi:hypothetical protein
MLKRKDMFGGAVTCHNPNQKLADDPGRLRGEQPTDGDLSGHHVVAPLGAAETSFANTFQSFVAIARAIAGESAAIG